MAASATKSVRVGTLSGAFPAYRPGRKVVTPNEVLGDMTSGEETPIEDSREPYPHIEDAEIKNHLPLVRQVVQRMLARKPPEIAVEDLISWGTIGLLDAMRKYDSTREASFATYAQYRIRGSILDYLRRSDWMPRSIRQKAHDIEAATQRLEALLGRPATDEEIAAELKVDLEEYNQAVGAIATTTVSTADLAFGRGDETAGEEVDLADTSDRGPMKHCMNTERVRILGDAIDTLPEKERIVVSLYYYEGLTMRELAEAMDLTEGRISQLHSQAMRRLRTGLEEVRPDITFEF